VHYPSVHAFFRDLTAIRRREAETIRDRSKI